MKRPRKKQKGLIIEFASHRHLSRAMRLASLAQEQAAEFSGVSCVTALKEIYDLSYMRSLAREFGIKKTEHIQVFGNA